MENSINLLALIWKIVNVSIEIMQKLLTSFKLTTYVVKSEQITTNKSNETVKNISYKYV